MVQARPAAAPAVRHAAEIAAGAAKQQLLAFFADLERELEKVEFFRPPDKRDTMQINLRNIFHRMEPTQQDIQTLHGVITGDRRRPQGSGAGRRARRRRRREMLRTLLAEHGQGRVPNERGPVRGLARLLRRNPTDAERLFWNALTRDRRFAGHGFKRQIAGRRAHRRHRVVSAASRDRARAADEGEAAAQARAERRAWLVERGYRVVDVAMAEVEADIASVLDRVSVVASEGVASKL